MHAPLIDAIIGWDIPTWSKFLPFCERFLGFNLGGNHALEVGARQGGLSLYLALKGYNVVCSDFEAPGVPAWILHARHGVAERITYLDVDILAPPYPDAVFDLIIFKSVLHALPQARLQGQAVRELHRLLRPGGLLLFAENLRASPVHRLLRRLFRPKWLLKQRRYPTEAEIRFWCREFREFHGETWGLLGIPYQEGRIWRRLVELDAAVIPLVPREWRYVILACARK
jgi:SAM-dependent methyltransferase